jgi:hypothetical protein
MMKMFMEILPIKKTDDVWIYELEPANKLIGSILLGLTILFFLLHAVQNKMTLHEEHYLFLAIILSFIFLVMTKKKVLEIDRGKKTINKWRRVLFLRKNQIRPTDDFDSIRIVPKTVPAEEGYLSTVYSLVLSGPAASLELLTVSEKEEADKCLLDLSAFLDLRPENTTV